MSSSVHAYFREPSAIEPKDPIAQAIAQAAIEFQRDCTGLSPGSATVLLPGDSLIVTLHEALSPVEKIMARMPAGAARVHAHHRALFRKSAATLHDKLKGILGVEVLESDVELKPAITRVVEVFPSGGLIQVFRLSQAVANRSWNTPKGHASPVSK